MLVTNILKVKYTDGPVVNQNFGFSPQLFLKYTDGPCGTQFVMHLVTKHGGLNALQSANYKDHSCTFGKSWGLNTLQSANHKDHLCT
ncbi:hypothetical protein Hanom_Chr10g00939191 [Helianthus anomalus]